MFAVVPRDVRQSALEQTDDGYAGEPKKPTLRTTHREATRSTAACVARGHQSASPSPIWQLPFERSESVPEVVVRDFATEDDTSDA
jgi:hypothetical protein